MMNNRLFFMLGMVLCLSAVHYARAQSAEQLALRTEGPAAVAHAATVKRAAPVANFEDLSNGERRIAEALFAAQEVSAASKAVWSLDQIAAARQDMGWSDIFHKMKRDRLIAAKSLPVVVNGGSARRIGLGRSANALAGYHRTPIIVISAGGRRTAFRLLGSRRSRGGHLARHRYASQGAAGGPYSRGLFVAGSMAAGSGGHGMGYGELTQGISVSPRVSEALDGRRARQVLTASAR